MGVKVGDNVKVRFTDHANFIVDLKVTTLCDYGDFIGEIQKVYNEDGSEVTSGGAVKLVKTEKRFQRVDLIRDKPKASAA
jgi:hypothetical protein